MKLMTFENKAVLLVLGLTCSSLLGLLSIAIPLKYCFLSLGAILLIALCFYRVEWGIGLFIASMLYEKSVLPEDITISLTRILGLPILSICLMNIIAYKKKFTFDIVKDGIIILLFVWMALSTLHAVDTEAALSNLLKYTQLIATYFILKTVIESEHQLQKVLNLMVMIGAGMAVFVIIPLINDPQSMLYSEKMVHSKREFGLSHDPNFFAQGLVYIVPICFYLILTKHKWHLIPLTIFSFLILSTFSRGGILGLFVVMGLSSFSVIKSAKRGFALAMLVILFSSGTFMLFNKGNKLVSRIESVQNLESSRTRLELLEVALDMGLQNPVFGVGLDNFRANSHLYGAQTHYEREAHNGYLEVFATLGLPGLILLLGVIYISFKDIIVYQKHTASKRDMKSRQNNLLMARFLMISFIGFLITSFFLSLLPQKIFWVLLAFSSILYQCNRSQIAAR